MTDRLAVPSHARTTRRSSGYTLTYPALDRSRLVLFFVLGENKAEALGAIPRGEDRPAAASGRPTGA